MGQTSRRDRAASCNDARWKRQRCRSDRRPLRGQTPVAGAKIGRRRRPHANHP